jgi:adenylate kinase
MLRAAVKTGDEYDSKVKENMDSGELLSDDLIMEMVAERLAEPDARARGFILDGCPRTTHQAEALAALMAPTDVDVAVDIEVPTIQAMRRLASRRVCIDCGANYSVTLPPKVNWTCDVCGGEVIQREDDTEDSITRRLELYERQTAPLIDWYTKRGQLAKVNGIGSPDAVLRRVIRAVEERRSHR